MRRALLVTAIGVVALVGLVLVALLTLSYGWQREWLRGELERQLTTSLAMPVVVDSIDGPLHREFTLRGLRVGDPAAPWLEVEALQLRVGSLRLWGRPTLRLEAVRIDAPRLTLSAASDDAAASDADPLADWPLRLSLGSLIVRDGRLEGIGDGSGIRVDFDGELDELTLDELATTDAIALEFALSDPDRTAEPWARGTARGRIASEGWELDELRITGPELALDAHGRGDTTRLETLELSLRDAAIERMIARVSSEPPPLAGEIELSATLHGPFRWPQGALSLHGRKLSSHAVALGDVDLEARSPGDGELVIEALQLSGGPIALESVAASTITADVARTSLDALRLRQPDAAGTLEIEAVLPGLAASPRAAGAEPAETRLSVKTRAWPLAALQPLWRLAGVEAAGTLDADVVVRSEAGSPVVKATGSVNQGEWVAGEWVAAGAELAFALEGDAFAPRVDLHGRIATLERAQQRLGRVDVALRSDAERWLTVERLTLTGGVVPLSVVPGSRLRVAGSRVELEQLQLESEGQRIVADGVIEDTTHQDLTLRIDALELGRSLATLAKLGLIDATPLRGRVDGKLAWQGTLTAPNLSADLVATDVWLGEYAVERVVARVETEGGVVRLESDWLRNGASPLQLRASLPRERVLAQPGSLLEHPSSRVEATLEAFDLVALAPFLPSEISKLGGLVDARADVRSESGSPVLQATGSVRQGELAVGTLVATGAELAFDLAGAANAPRFDLRGTIASTELEQQRLGSVDLALRSDSNRNLTVDRLSLTGGIVSLDVVPGSQLRFVGERVELVAFQLQSGGQRIVADGVIEGTASKGLTLELNGLDVGSTLATLTKLGLIDETPVRGRVDGKLAWQGTFAAPNLSADLVASDVWLDEFAVDRVVARVETEGGVVRVESDWLRDGTSPLQLRASLPRDRVLAQPRSLLEHPSSRVEATLEAFDLVALAPFLPSEVSKIGGLVDARIDARGDAVRPKLSGTLELEEGTLGLSALGKKPLEPVSAQLGFDNDRISLDRLSIGTAEAGVTARGEARIEGDRLGAVDLGIEFTKFPLDARGLVRGTVSGPLRLAGKPKAFALTGKLDLADLKIAIPEEDDATVKEIRVISADGDASGLAIREADAEDSILDPLRVDLEVHIARNSWARGRGAEVELQGDLRAKKEPRGPMRFDGSVETLRGTYEIYGRRFRIERGEAVLDGAEDPDPVLDIRALHRVRDVRIYAILEGRLSEPRLRFESKPELTETDIASYLLLGRPASGGEGAPPALDAVAAQVATGAAVREFERLLGGTLPVDLLDVRMEKSGDTSELRAGVGKYVGDRLFLHYERGFGDEPSDELKAEYELDENWSVESSFSNEGETSADLIFEIEY